MTTQVSNHNSGTPRVLLYCIAALLCMSAIVLPAMAATLYVDASGAGDFTEIQPAIDAASPGDTIYIRPGTYTAEYGFSVADTSDLTILGESADSVTLTSPEYHLLSIYSSSGIHVENITLVSTSISLMASNNVIAHTVIKDISPEYNGIDLYGSSNIIRDNTITGADSLGIFISDGSSYNQIENNIIRDGNGVGLGILGGDNTFIHNSIIDNAGEGIVFYNDNYYLENNRFYLNTISGNSAPASTWETTPPANTYWVSPGPVTYTYNGNTYSGILGNFWDADYTGTDADGNGVGDTAYTVPESLGSDTAPLMETPTNYFGGGGSTPAPEFPTIAFPIMVIGTLAVLVIVYRRK